MLVANQKVIGTEAKSLIVRFSEMHGARVDTIEISWDGTRENRRSVCKNAASVVYVRRDARIFAQRFQGTVSFVSLLRIAAINGFFSDSRGAALQVADSLIIGKRLSGSWYGVLDGDGKRFFSSCTMKGDRKTLHYLMQLAAKAGFLLKETYKNK